MLVFRDTVRIYKIVITVVTLFVSNQTYHHIVILHGPLKQNLLNTGCLIHIALDNHIACANQNTNSGQYFFTPNRPHRQE